MKVLWFTNTPCNAINFLKLKINSGGWLISLENELKKVRDLELSVSFFYERELESFKYQFVDYYPIYRPTITKRNLSPSNIYNYYFNSNYDKLISKCLRIVEITKPDIIHIHGTENIFGNICKYIDIPCLLSLQGIINPYFLKYFDDVPKDVIRKYSNLTRKLIGISIHNIYDNFKKMAINEKNIFNHVKYLSGRTEWDRNVSSILAPQAIYFHLDEMLRDSFYSYRFTRKVSRDGINLVTVISSPPYKGLATIVEISKILKEKIKFTWNIIGLNSNDEIVKIVKKWKKINFENLNLKFLGSLEEMELVKTLLSSDIFIQTSRIENSPNSLCEAMMLGMPIIASNVGGTSSLLKHGEEGFLVQEGEPFAFVHKILILANDGDLVKKLGSNAAIRAQERHNKSKIVNNLLSIYNAIYKKDYN